MLCIWNLQSMIEPLDLNYDQCLLPISYTGRYFTYNAFLHIETANYKALSA